MTKLNTLILLDRSGSMADKWQETLSSVNAYVKELTVDADVTVAAFDHHSGLQFNVIRNKVDKAAYKPITDAEASPRGGTPLLDSVARIIGLAKDANSEKTVIVVMTDGQENQSTEVTKEQVQKLVKECEDKKWEVVFLGANFNAFNNATMSGVSMDKTLNIATANLSHSLRRMSQHTSNYAATGQAIKMSVEDRTEAGM